MRRETLSIDETYHIYNRGAHKQIVFQDESDYRRFQLLLYLANSKKSIEFSNLVKKYGGRTSVKMFEEERHGGEMVDVLTYSLLPNHFHLVLRQRLDRGISEYMRKLITAYTMYFNTKYEHSGVLFQGRFKSRHINTEPYFRWIFSYTHLNPLELYEPGWEENGIRNIGGVRVFMNKYPYSSYPDYCSDKVRLESRILTKSDIPDFLDNQNDLEDMLRTFAKDRAS